MSVTKRPTYDCHDKTYSVVESELENWLLLNHMNTPIDIITGNSEGMKRIVFRLLEKHDFNYVIPQYNQGMVIVL